MAKFKRLQALLVILAVTIASFGQVTQAAESTSTWAIMDVQMASVYGLGEADVYSNYTEGATAKDLATIEANLFQLFSLEKETETSSQELVTREVVLNNLVKVISEITETEVSEAIPFLVDAKILKGVGNGDYALDDICTKEQLLVLAKRTFEHLAYHFNMDSVGAYWKVSDEDNTVYLLGSIHVGDGTLYPLSESIIEGYEDSQKLAVEANILNTEADLEYLETIIYLKDTTIDKIISEEVYEQYAEFMEAVGIPKEVYDILKPWYASLLIQSLSITSGSYSGDLGIDVFFLLNATYGGKEIVELEGAMFQFDMFNSFSDGLQEMILASALVPAETSVEAVDYLSDLWRTGDMKTLEELMFSIPPVTEIDIEYFDKMWTDRNVGMVEHIEAFLADENNDNYYVVVGAGHMISEVGIIELLLEKGYDVERVY